MTRPYLLLGAPDWVTLSAFAAGLDLVGRNCVWGHYGAVDIETHRPAAIVIDGMRAGGRACVRQAEAWGIPAIVIDNGFLKRVHTAADNDHGHFYVGFGGLGWTPERAPDRARFDALGVDIFEAGPAPDGPALIFGQVPGDASHGLSGPALQSTYEQLMLELRAAGVERVEFRPHPLGAVIAGNLADIRPAGAETLQRAIRRARFVVSLNSNAGLDALLQGVPAVTLLPSHYSRLAYRWPVHPLDVLPPDPEQVADHCARLAWAQWTLAEMRAGLPQRWLLEEGLIP